MAHVINWGGYYAVVSYVDGKMMVHANRFRSYDAASRSAARRTMQAIRTIHLAVGATDMANSLERAAYIAGWNCTMTGADPRYSNPYRRKSAEAYAWNAGALDAFNAEDDEEPEPECAGF